MTNFLTYFETVLIWLKLENLLLAKGKIVYYNIIVSIEEVKISDKDKVGRNKWMSSRINITRREFQDSYRRHYKMYKESAGNDKSRRLILFYSVECGLKSLLMKDME